MTVKCGLPVTLEDMVQLDNEIAVAEGYMTFAELEEYQAEYDAYLAEQRAADEYKAYLVATGRGTDYLDNYDDVVNAWDLK